MAAFAKKNDQATAFLPPAAKAGTGAGGVAPVTPASPIPSGSPVAASAQTKPKEAQGIPWPFFDPFGGMFGDKSSEHGGLGAKGPHAEPGPKATETKTGQASALGTDSPTGPALPTSTQPSAPDPKEISQLAADIRKDTDGHLFANPSSTLQVLRGRTPEELAAIKAEYKAHYGTDLDAALGSQLAGKDKAEYQALMAQDSKDPASQARAAILGLQNAEKDNFLGIGGKHADKAAVEKILKGLTPETRAELAAQGFDMDGYLQQYYSGDELKKVQAQGSGDKTAEMAAELKIATHSGWFGASTDSTKILDTLAQCKTDAERKALEDAYKQISNGQDLASMVTDKLKNEDQAAAKALMDGNASLAAAYQIEAASKPQGLFAFAGIGGPDKDRLNKQFENKSEDELKAIRAAYNATYTPPGKQNDQSYNAFDAKLKSTLKDDDLLKAQQLAETGKVSDELSLKMAMSTGLFGMFTDDKKVNSILEGKTKQEIEELKKNYAALTNGGDLEKELTSRTGGDAGFEVQMNLRGAPSTPEEMVQRANERYEHQRGNGMRNFFVDTFGGEAGKDLDRQNRRLNQAYDKAKSGDGQIEQNEMAEINQLADWNKIDNDGVQERTNQIANTAGTVAGVTAGVALTIATAGTASPLVAAALSAGVPAAAIPMLTAAVVAGGSGAASMITKAVVKGGGYGGDELKSDLVDTGFGIAGGVATAGIGQLMQGAKMDVWMRTILKIDPTKAATELSALEKLKLSVLSKGLEGGMGGVASGATNRANWEGGAEKLIEGMAVGGLTGFARGSFGGLISNVPETLADETFAKEHPELKWMQNVPGFGDPAKKDQDFGLGKSILNGFVTGTSNAAKNYGSDTLMETLKDGNTWSDGNFLNSLVQHGEDNLNEGKWAKDIAGGVRDGVMSNRMVENKIRTLVGADQVAPGTKPSDWGNSLKTMDDKYNVGGAKGLIGGLLGGALNSAVDAANPDQQGVQNKGLMFLNNMYTEGLAGAQSGIEGVTADQRAAEAARKTELLRETWKNLQGTEQPWGDNPLDDRRRALRYQVQDLFGPIKPPTRDEKPTTPPTTTSAPATTPPIPVAPDAASTPETAVVPAPQPQQMAFPGFSVPTPGGPVEGVPSPGHPGTGPNPGSGPSVSPDGAVADAVKQPSLLGGEPTEGDTFGPGGPSTATRPVPPLETTAPTGEAPQGESWQQGSLGLYSALDDYNHAHRLDNLTPLVRNAFTADPMEVIARSGLPPDQWSGAYNALMNERFKSWDGARKLLGDDVTNALLNGSAHELVDRHVGENGLTSLYANVTPRQAGKVDDTAILAAAQHNFGSALTAVDNPSWEETGALFGTNKIENAIMNIHGLPGQVLGSTGSDEWIDARPGQFLADMAGKSEQLRYFILNSCYGGMGKDQSTVSKIAEKGITTIGYDLPLHAQVAAEMTDSATSAIAHGQSPDAVGSSAAIAGNYHNHGAATDYQLRNAATIASSGLSDIHGIDPKLARDTMLQEIPDLPTDRAAARTVLENRYDGDHDMRATYRVGERALKPRVPPKSASEPKVDPNAGKQLGFGD